MRAIETDVLATGGASWAAKVAQIGGLLDEVELLRQERAMSLELAAALLWAMGDEHAA